MANIAGDGHKRAAYGCHCEVDQGCKREDSQYCERADGADSAERVFDMPDADNARGNQKVEMMDNTPSWHQNLAVGGFGPLNNEHSKGVSWYVLKIDDDDITEIHHATIQDAENRGGKNHNTEDHGGNGRAAEGYGDTGCDGECDGKDGTAKDGVDNDQVDNDQVDNDHTHNDGDNKDGTDEGHPDIILADERSGHDDRVSLESRGLLIDLPSATWLVKDDEFVYAVLENSDCISSLRLSAVDGVPQLKERSRVRVLGKGPTHAIVAVDDRGDKHLIAANYGDGSLNVHPIDSTGCVGEAVQMLQAVGDGPLPAQEGPHAHWILPLPDGRVLSTDLGADRIYVHHWLDGKLIRTGYVSLAPGTGPRDLHLLPSNDATLWRVAVVCEWACTVLVLEGASEKSSAVMQSQAVDSYDAGADRDDSDSVEIRDNTLQVVQSVSLGASDGDQAASLAFVPDGALPDMAHKTVVDSRVAKCGNSESGGAEDKAAALSHAREIDARHHCERQHSDIDQSGDGSKRIVCADGMAYIGLRGSDRIIPLRWSGKRFSRLADSNVPNWQGQGVSCGGGRPRQLLALGTVLLAANETSDNIAVFRISAGGRPVEVASVSAPSPTVMLVLD